MKKMFVVAAVAACAALVAAGCSNIKELNKALGEASTADEVSTMGLQIVQNKTTKAEVIQNIGAPSMTFNDAKGEAWVYSRVAVRRNQSSGNLTANFAAIFPYKGHSLSHGGGIAGVGGNASVASQNSSYKTAALVIYFNKHGCVSHYEFTATSF